MTQHATASAFPELEPPREPIACIARSVDGGRVLMCCVLRLVAIALLLGAALVWLRPGSITDPQTGLATLVLSILLAGVAAGLMQSSGKPEPPTIEIDAALAEIRLLGRGRQPQVLAHFRFDALGWAECNAAYFTFWRPDGGLLAEVAVSDPAARAALERSLREAGALT
ncbi:hypothetical protein KDD17_05160 [Sulfitobacter albidus]|uniref:DUF2244 domain-containing protein n=1 Tax=Sulfitobacter albidus TaxID=2829501 RepID=A0A975PN48_9RHOB|nr:hypothetical protein [Sulfitobacter albidus]QUJ77389.1 hypothetical protein KDD17_05160 [Sulfitobacter albidus]